MYNILLNKFIIINYIHYIINLKNVYNFYFNGLKLIGLLNIRLAWQNRYVLYNWVYTTNHKRIAINYFWFVLFAGVVGMVLATIIRLEMAYPGTGILAGDNSQYLSIVTAHGVIMVFFMAMPMLFGFFGNFLLPTQLGVHDVAFPRMNSAAFWFLPASLLTLCQLVCIDRRYQRMNCFNVRELQSLLRNRFFFEINNTLVHTTNTLQTLLIRYKLNNLTLSAVPELHTYFLLHQYPLYQSFIEESLWSRINNYGNYIIDSTIGSVNNYFSLYNTLSFINLSYIFFLINITFIYYELIYIINNVYYILKKICFEIDIINFISTTIYTHYYYIFNNIPYSYQTSGKSDFNIYERWFNSNVETIDNNRNLLSSYPNITYKIKTGNYLPDNLARANYSYLYTSFIFKTINNYKAEWFQSTILPVLLNEDLGFNRSAMYLSLTFNQNKLNFFLLSSYLFNINSSNNIFFSKFYINNYLFQFYINNLYYTQSKQHRILNNWRFLQLNREGWRCRMLIARYQRSLYHRYVYENELFWIVERNAKDLLPGWAMITPFASRTKYTLIGKTDIGIAIVVVTLIASMISSANFLMTYRYLSTLNNRKMRDARSFFSEAVIAASWMMIAANPMLILGLLMLLADRHWKTSFFDYSGGGDTILFQHMFWFFGHPEVYIIIIPCFGITNTLLSFYLRKRISARASLLYSLYTIAFLGFFVWGHHMYMVGLSHTTRMLYSTLTVMISVPAATKIMHWLVTFVNSAIHFEMPFILVLAFIFYFVSGGISGMAVAHTGMDVLFHDTFYVIGHFHVMLAGSLMFAGFAAFYFYLPSIFGVRYSRLFAYLHIFYYSIGQIFTVIPMIWLGYIGMPRRVLDYPNAMGGWHSLISSAHMITVSGILAFVIMLFDSLRKKKSYIIKTFGIGRYNTRLNFFLYQIARNRYWLMKHFTLLKIRPQQLSYLIPDRRLQLVAADTILFYYTFSTYPYKIVDTWL